MKNLLLIVIDSLGNKNRNSLDFDIMPFFETLTSKSVYFPNMYSEAPYTEAAVMSMLCGHDTLDEGGYYFRFRDSKTVFDYFYESGYDVINYIQPHVFPSSIIRGNTDYFYNVCFDFHVLWSYRLQYYANKKNRLSTSEIKKIKELLEDNFKEWIHFFSAYLNNDNCISLIRANIENSVSDSEVMENLNLVKKEFSKFKEDMIKYIYGLYTQEENHILFKIKVLDQNIKAKCETKQWVIKNYESLFKRIYQKNKKINKKVSKFKFINFLNCLYLFLRKRGKNNFKNCIRYIVNFKNSFHDNDLYNRINPSYDSFKAAPSLVKHFEHFLTVLENRESKQPFMACLHVDDIHNPEIFFTYDSDDKELLKEEFKLIESTLDKIGDFETGSISYYLSLAYIDEKLKNIFKILKQKGILENTTIMITGDHGFSFDDKIIRNSRVNNFYLENYQVPFIIFDKDLESNVITTKCSSKDILPTALHIFNLPENSYVTGQSLLTPYDKVITMEYMGGGCPDLDSRDVFLSAQSEEWHVVTSLCLNDSIESIEILEIYNLKSDPDQTHNLFGRNISEKGYHKIIYIIKQRYLLLKENYIKWKERDEV